MGRKKKAQKDLYDSPEMEADDKELQELVDGPSEADETVLKELADGLKKNEKKTTPLHHKDEVFHKDEITDGEAAFEGEKGKTEKGKKGITLKKPESLEVKNTPDKKELDVKNKKTGTTRKRRTPKAKTTVLKVKRLSDTAKLPAKGHPSDAGWDLFANTDATLTNGNHLPTLVSTGIAVEFPTTVWGQIETRSGMARDGVFVVGGIIDSGYRGEIVIMLQYLGISPKIKISKGDKIAQLVLRTNIPSSVEEVDEINDTERGEGGFGSTGK